MKKLWLILNQDKATIYAIIYLFLMIALAIFPEHIAPYDPNKINLDNVYAGSSRDFFLGTDYAGRDVLSRIIYGARNSLLAGPLSMIIPLFIGVPLGLLSGYFGKVFDEIVMRIVDAMLSFPAVMLAIVITGLLGPSYQNAIIAIGIINIPHITRLVRGQSLALKEEVYVESARAMGASSGRIMFYHMLPNMMPVLIVDSYIRMGYSIYAEAAMSFLHLATQSPNISWGTVIRDGQIMFFSQPSLIIFPGLFIMLTIMSINYLGDGLRRVIN